MTLADFRFPDDEEAEAAELAGELPLLLTLVLGGRQFFLVTYTREGEMLSREEVIARLFCQRPRPG